MKHTMKLRPNPFRMILCGEKTYELRLYDEKRQCTINEQISKSAQNL